MKKNNSCPSKKRRYSLHDALRGKSRFYHDHHAVSEVVGTLMLIGIGVSLFIGLSVAVYMTTTLFSPVELPATSLRGSIYVDDTKIIVEHCGGEPVSGSAQISIDIGGNVSSPEAVSSLLNGNGNAWWEIGEYITFDVSDGRYGGFTSLGFAQCRVSITVVDPSLNAIVFMSVIQDGLTGIIPQVTTQPATAITQTSALLHMDYDFKFEAYTDETVYFQYSQWQSEDWNDWSNNIGINNTPDLLRGSHEFLLENLAIGADYRYRACLEYTMDGISYPVESRTIIYFTTDTTALGKWHFDENTGTTAFDSSGHNHHGLLEPNNPDWLTPEWKQADQVEGASALNNDGYNDYINIQDAGTPINPSDKMSIEAWVKPPNPVKGEVCSIPETVFDTSTTFGDPAISFYQPDAIRVGEEAFTATYAIVSRSIDEPGNPIGSLITIKINRTGTYDDPWYGNVTPKNITNCYYDYLLFENTYCLSPRIINVQDNIYAIVYTGQDEKGWVKTVRIAKNGDIDDTIIDSYEFTGSKNIICRDPDMINYSYDVVNKTYYYAIVYSTDADSYFNIGCLRTINITQTGDIIGTVDVENFSYFKAPGDEPAEKFLNHADIIKRDEDTLVVVYAGADGDGWIRAFTINLTTRKFSDTTPLNSCYFDSTNGIDPKIIHVNNDIYAIVYLGRGTYDNTPELGLVRTYQIPNNGSLENPVNKKIKCVFDPPPELMVEPTNSFNEFHIVPLNERSPLALDDPYYSYYAISYRGTLNKGYIDVIKINNTYGSDNITFMKDQNNVYNFSNIPFWQYSDIGWPIMLPAGDGFNANYPVYLFIFKTSSPSSVDDSNNGIIRSTYLSINGIGHKLYKADYLDYRYMGITNFFTPDAIQLSTDNDYYYFAVVYRGEDNVGWLKTFAVKKDLMDTGNPNRGSFLSGVFIDSYQFSTTCFNPRIILIDETQDIYCIVYTTSADGHIMTLTISDNGDIPELPVRDGPDSFKALGVGDVYYPTINHTSGDWYLLCYGGSDGSSTDFIVQSCQIFSSNGTIIIPSDTGKMSVIDNVADHGKNGDDVVHVSGDVYAIVYGSMIQTLSCSDEGVLMLIRLETLFADDVIFMPEIIQMDPLYVVSASDSSNVGHLFTIEIDPTGTPIDIRDNKSNFFASGLVSLLKVFNDTLALSCFYHSGSEQSLQMKSFRVRNETGHGDISKYFDSGVSKPLQYNFLRLLPVDLSRPPYKFIMIGAGPEEDAIVHTIQLGIDTPQRSIIERSDAYRLYANMTNVSADIIPNDGTSNYTCSVPLYSGTWNYIVVTYTYQSGEAGRGSMTLYNYYDTIDNPEIYSLSEPSGGFKEIKTSDEPVVFGGYQAVYDEFIIHHDALTAGYIRNRFVELMP